MWVRLANWRVEWPKPEPKLWHDISSDNDNGVYTDELCPFREQTACFLSALNCINKMESALFF